MKDHRPISFKNIDSRLSGFESVRLHENDWRNIREYIDHLEMWIILVEAAQKKGEVFKSFDEYMLELVR